MASSIDALLLGKLGLSAEQQELVRAKMLLGLPCTFCFLFEGETDLQYHHTGECHPIHTSLSLLTLNPTREPPNQPHSIL